MTETSEMTGAHPQGVPAPDPAGTGASTAQRRPLPATAPATPAMAEATGPTTEAGQQDRVSRSSSTPLVTLVLLIPAYRPDDRLADLVSRMTAEREDCVVLIVDDGSGPDYVEVFAAARSRGAHVIGSPVNRGKGNALRKGLAQAASQWPEADVVCADADGQHTPTDIAAVAHRVGRTRHMTLGVRRFSGPVPLRSRLGNTMTALLFRGATGWRLHDTQTGLRGYPAGQLAWLQDVPGDRYEYELACLLRAHELGLEVEEVDIATVYEPGNTSSHFRPLQDSVRIYAPLLAFTASSLAGFVIDWVGVVGVHALTGNLLGAVVSARIISGTANFFMNRRVFRARRGTVGRTALRYTALALALVAASYVLLRLLTGIGIPLGLAKILGDSTIYVSSYLAQRHLVFRERA